MIYFCFKAFMVVVLCLVCCYCLLFACKSVVIGLMSNLNLMAFSFFLFLHGILVVVFGFVKKVVLVLHYFFPLPFCLLGEEFGLVKHASVWNLRVETCLYWCKLEMFHGTSYGDQYLLNDRFVWCTLSLIGFLFPFSSSIDSPYLTWRTCDPHGPRLRLYCFSYHGNSCSSIGFIWNFCLCLLGFCDFCISLFGVDSCTTWS